MGYKYEMHCHTNVVSKCANQSPLEMLKMYKQNGYSGVFVTEHFMNGNSVIDKTLPWERQIEEYFKGYHECKKYSKEVGIDVFMGVETSYKGTDMLFYGLTEEFFLNHPEIMNISMKHSVLLGKENGGLLIQAHPFRRADYIDHVRIFAEWVDGVEVFNANTGDKENYLANVLADTYGLIKTSGSDSHGVNWKTLGGIEFPEKIKDEKHMTDLLRQGRYDLIKQKNILGERK